MKLIPLAKNSKSPLAGADWHDRISDDPAEHESWLRQGLNLGMPVEENGRVVVDFDRGLDAARATFRRHACNVLVLSRRGPHFHYEGKSATGKFEHGDVKGNGYVVYPPSVVDGHQYRLIQTGPLQPFPAELFPLLHKDKKEVNRREIKNVKAYLAKVESIQGQNGSGGLVRAAAICRDGGLSESEATIEMLLWNAGPTVSPKWPDAEIARCITRVYGKGK